MPRFIVEPAMLLKESTQLLEVAKKGGANVDVLSCLQEEFLSFKKAVAKLLPVAEKGRSVRANAEKKVRSLDMESSMLKHKGALFNKAMTAVNKEMFVVKVECACLRWNREEALSKLKTLENGFRESLKNLSEETAEGSCMIQKQFETKMAKGLVKVLWVSDMKQL